MSAAGDPQGDQTPYHDRQLNFRSHFRGHAIPVFASGSHAGLLGAREGGFLFGLTDPNFDDMGTWDQFVDLLHHTALPLLVTGWRLRLADHDDEE